MIGEIVSKEASLTCNHVLVTRCLVGQDCTFVSLSSGQAGTAMHFFTPNPEGDGELFGMIRDLPVVSPGEPLPNWSTSAVEFLSRPFVKEFEGQSAARLLDQYRSSDPILRSLWLSAVNALLNMPARGDPSGTLSHMCGIERTDTVGLVGYFYPVLPELRANCARIHVFDLRDIPGCHPPSMEPVLLPHCDVVVITGTTMLNDTLEGLLPLCSRARTVALVGPSVPLSRELLQSTALTLVAGSVVIDPEPVARGIARGGSARSVKRLLQKRHISQWD